MRGTRRSHGATLTDGNGAFRMDMPQIVPAFGQPHGHLAYDAEYDGHGFQTVFLRPVNVERGRQDARRAVCSATGLSGWSPLRSILVWGALGAAVFGALDRGGGEPASGLAGFGLYPGGVLPGSRLSLACWFSLCWPEGIFRGSPRGARGYGIAGSVRVSGYW